MQTIISIGRDDSNHIILNDKMVSRKHAQLIIYETGQVLIKDLGSSNGTFVNGNRISEQVLAAGDIVKCGSSFLNWSLAVNESRNQVSPNDKKPVAAAISKPFSFSSKQIDVDSIRHEKEKTYFFIKIIFSSLIWIAGITAVILTKLITIWVFLYVAVSILFISIALWISGQILKSILYGNSVKVNGNQYPEIHKIASDFSQRLGLSYTPEIFICNRNGLINAIAIKGLSKRYILLYSSLVDLMLANNKNDALSMIIGHELGHHAAGHLSVSKNLFLSPASLIPFLWSAYHRACELTADRIGFVLSDNLVESQNALIALALGSERLIPNVNVIEFCTQENEVPEIVGFIQKIFSGYPRTTRRVIEITSFGNKNKIS